MRWWAVQKLCRRRRVRKRKGARSGEQESGERAGQSCGGEKRLLNCMGREAGCVMCGTLGAALRTGCPVAGGARGAKSFILGRVPTWKPPQDVQMEQKQLMSSDASSPRKLTLIPAPVALVLTAGHPAFTSGSQG